jgi:cytochrome c oxidase subunit III
MSAQPAPAGVAIAEHDQNRGVPTALLGMVLFISSEVMFFGGFFGAYFDIRAGQKVWPPATPAIPHLETVPIAAILTVLLVTSSFTAHAGLLSIKRGDRRGLLRWLVVTLVLGFSFLALQLYDYAHLGFGLRDGIFATLFYTMTGFHFAHVLGGALFMYLLTLQAKNGAFTAEDHTAVTSGVIYWHFVDVVWIGLFSTYYLLR